MDNEALGTLVTVLGKCVCVEEENKCWKSLSSNEWVTLLTKLQNADEIVGKVEQKCDEVGGWAAINSRDLVVLLSRRPELADKSFPPQVWKDIQGCERDAFGVRRSGWTHLLGNHPELAPYCDLYDGWRTFKGDDWRIVLSEQPQFVNRCNEHNGWKSLSIFQLVYLLRIQPHLSEKCGVNERWMELDGDLWLALLSKQPQFVNQCDCHNGWGKFTIKQWVSLLRDQPHLSDK